MLKLVLCLALPIAVFSQFLTAPVDTISYVGDEVLLQCSIENFAPGDSVGWDRGVDLLYAGTMEKAEYESDAFKSCCYMVGDHTTGDFSLQINKTSLDDGATWKCRYTAAGSIQEREAYLHVLPEAPFCQVNDADPANPMPVIEGSTADLTCISDATPPGALHWTIGGEDTGESGNSPALWNPTFNRDDSGKLFTCEMRHPTLTKKVTCEEEIYFDVQYAPDLRVKVDKDMKVIEGTELNAVCVVKNANPAIDDGSLAWTTEVAGVDIPSDNAGVLNIVGVTRSQAGEYVCSAQNTFHDGTQGSSEKTITVDVQYKPVVDLPSNITLKEGDMLKINCSEYVTDGNPAAEMFKWVRFNADLQMDPVLMIDSVESTNKGMYTCKAYNRYFNMEEAEGTDYIDVYVQTRPVVTVQSTTHVKEGADLELKCTVTADPEPEIVQWFTDSSEDPISTGDVLKLENVGRGEAVEYRCNAKNRFYDGTIGEGNGKTLVIVEYSPSIKVDGPSMAVSEGKALSLNCTVDSQPKPMPNSYEWKLERDGKVTILSEKSPYLDLGSASGDNTGNYTCTTTIQFSDGVMETETASLAVTVKTAPKIVNKDDNTVNAKVGSTAVLECKGEGEPDPQFQWTNSTDGDIENSDRFMIEQKVDGSVLVISTLTISSVSNADYGIYRCTATNDVGTDTFQVELKARSKPEAPKDVTLVQGSSSIVVEWTPGYDGGDMQTFIIEYKNLETKYQDKVAGIKAGPGLRMNHTLKGLNPKSEYQITVIAVNSEGNVPAAPSTVKTDAAPKAAGQTGSNGGVIAAIIIVIIVLIIVITVLVVFILRRKKAQRLAQPQKKDEEMPLNQKADEKGEKEGEKKEPEADGKNEESQPLKSNEEKPEVDEKIEDVPKKEDGQPPEETKVDEPENENEPEKEPEQAEEQVSEDAKEQADEPTQD